MDSIIGSSIKSSQHTAHKRHFMHVDGVLFVLLILLASIGIAFIYSSGSQNMTLVNKQLTRIAISVVVLVIAAQIPPRKYYHFAPIIFWFAFSMLVIVLILGHVGKGAQRWLNLGLISFEPSELMKLAMPLILARTLHEHNLPPNLRTILVCCGLILPSVWLVAKQPDLGTALLLLSTGLYALFLAGLSWKTLLSGLVSACISLPVLWFNLHQYQRQRVLTFLNPERDPLGAGYHIIQSKIAIGSGGLTGKGWLNASQAKLQFLPEHTTDFIFAVGGEEFGWLGSCILLSLITAIIARCFYIAAYAQDTFSRILVAMIGLLYFTCVFVNIGMVCGLLPVVGIPLPLISYGGTTCVTFMAAFGIVMSIHTQRKLMSS